MRKTGTCQDKGSNYRAVIQSLTLSYLLSKSEKSGKGDTKRDRHLRDSAEHRAGQK